MQYDFWIYINSTARIRIRTNLKYMLKLKLIAGVLKDHNEIVFGRAKD